MTTTTSPSLPRVPARVSTPMITLRTPLGSGEDAETYAKLLADAMASVRPSSIIEEMWLRDVVNNYWEIERLRRYKAGRLAAMRADGMAAVLRGLGETVSGADELARRWSARQPTAIGDVRERLEAAGLDHDTVHASTLALHLDEFEHIEELIAGVAHVPAKRMPVRRQEHAPNEIEERVPIPQERNTLSRRAAALREIGFHRADFADRLAAATQTVAVEDAEFAEVTLP